VPEGDTILRTANSLRTWIGGRTVTAASSGVPGLAAGALVGRTCEAVEVHGKHLLMRFAPGDGDPAAGRAALVLHTHMRMTGSWHVYAAGATWKRPRRQARIVIEFGDRVVVCFNAPVVELRQDTDDGTAVRQDTIGHLGPDVLVQPLDLAEVVRRARVRPATTALGELLLDQRVVAGIGNIYRCEALFLCGVHPWRALGDVDDDAVRALVQTASTLMHANVPQSAGVAVGRDLGRGPDGTWVYRRAGRPCHRCGTTVRSRPQGVQARTAYWCPTCQPPPPGALP
jgi:endonuclease VIII